MGEGLAELLKLFNEGEHRWDGAKGTLLLHDDGIVVGRMPPGFNVLMDQRNFLDGNCNLNLDSINSHPKFLFNSFFRFAKLSN